MGCLICFPTSAPSAVHPIVPFIAAIFYLQKLNLNPVVQMFCVYVNIVKILINASSVKNCYGGIFEKCHAWQKIAENDDRKWRKFLHNWRETTENGNIFLSFSQAHRLIGQVLNYFLSPAYSFSNLYSFLVQKHHLFGENCVGSGPKGWGVPPL